MNQPSSIDDLKPAPYNPRAIPAESMAALRKSLAAFADISGIVWNSRTGHLVCGHQRVAALRAEHGNGLRLDAGAVITPDGERFPIRVVDWAEAQEKAANIAANSPLIAGEFTDGLQPVLDEINIALPDLARELRLEDIAVPSAPLIDTSVDRERQGRESTLKQMHEGSTVEARIGETSFSIHAELAARVLTRCESRLRSKDIPYAQTLMEILSEGLAAGGD